MSEEKHPNSEMQLVIFKLGQEEYGVSILQVQEIKRITEITRVPHTPDYIKGVINLRGSVLPVIDLKNRLNLPQQGSTEDMRIIIVKVKDISVGMIVDAVSEVMTINEKDIDSPDVVAGSVSANYLSGVGKLEDRLLILLNLEEITGLGQEVNPI